MGPTTNGQEVALGRVTEGRSHILWNVARDAEEAESKTHSDAYRLHQVTFKTRIMVNMQQWLHGSLSSISTSVNDWESMILCVQRGGGLLLATLDVFAGRFSHRELNWLRNIVDMQLSYH